MQKQSGIIAELRMQNGTNNNFAAETTGIKRYKFEKQNGTNTRFAVETIRNQKIHAKAKWNQQRFAVETI